MTHLVAYLLIFVGLGSFFLFIHMVMGKFLRPSKPETDKLTIYECGEPTIGSAWIQFDLRYYVVALLFVIFDVEVAFFFPWAVVFGKANTLAQQSLDAKSSQRLELSRELTAALPTNVPGAEIVVNHDTANVLAWIGFMDILVFFGVLLVGFAYLWRRGDIDWVRSVASEQPATPPAIPPPPLRAAQMTTSSAS